MEPERPRKVPEFADEALGAIWEEFSVFVDEELRKKFNAISAAPGASIAGTRETSSNEINCPPTIGEGSTCHLLPSVGCYCIVERLETWNRADWFCRQHQMSLVSIETQEEQNRLFQLLKNSEKEYDFGFWTSGSLNDSTGTWTWASSGQPLTFTNWRKGQPDNFDNDQHAMYIWKVEPFDWIDSYRHWVTYFICEIPDPGQKSLPATQSPVVAAKVCPKHISPGNPCHKTKTGCYCLLHIRVCHFDQIPMFHECSMNVP